MKLLLISLLVLVCCACEDSEELVKESFVIELLGENNPTTLNVGSEQYSEKIIIKSNAAWKIDKTTTATWLSITPAFGEGDGSVTLSVEANEESVAREEKIDFYMNEKKIHSLTVKQALQELPDKERILLMDIAFNNDGTATDMSPMKHDVQSVEGSGLMTYYNDSYGCYVARFNHTSGTAVNSGFYKIDYQSNQEFKDALADGHALEVLFMYDSEPQIGKEVKMFSSMQAGGTGFLLAKEKGEITFLPNLTSGGWQWNRSGVVPERGKYYHVIGVWNKEMQKASIYVNGELKGTIDAKGNLKFPTPVTCQWFGIGGDAAAGTAEAAWKGEVVLSRIYDNPLSAEDVTELWNKVKDKQPQGSAIEVSDLIFFTNYEVKAGSKYRIVGKGFKNGDKVKLESLEEKEGFICNAVATERYIDVEIPSNFVSGKYRLLLMRESAQFPIGMATLTITNNPIEFVAPKIIAHRGFHTVDDKASENSIASFIAAQRIGVYGSEADFYITKDGVVVCYHDPTIAGMKIEDVNYVDIQDKRLNNGEKIPTLEAYLEQLKKDSNTKLVIEIKSHSSNENHDRIVKSITEIVDKMGLNARTDYIAFSYYVCQKLAQSVPEGTIIGYLNGDKDPKSIDKGINCIDYSMNSLKNNPQWIKDAHEKGMKVNVWTVNSPQEMLDFMAMGVDFITTDYPNLLKELIAKFEE